MLHGASLVGRVAILENTLELCVFGETLCSRSNIDPFSLLATLRLCVRESLLRPSDQGEPGGCLLLGGQLCRHRGNELPQHAGVGDLVPREERLTLLSDRTTMLFLKLEGSRDRVAADVAAGRRDL